MKGRKLVRAGIVTALLASSAMCFAKADGSWLKNVAQSDRERVNPYAGKPDAIAAGVHLYADNCARCHGENAEGLHSRPSLKSERIEHATDGEIAWLLKNGNAFRGMPGWGALPEQERWQIVAYIRSLNTTSPATPQTEGQK